VLNWLGVAIGAAGVLSVVPVLQDLKYGFGLLVIVWFVWLGVVMVRTPSRAPAPASIAVTTSASAAASSTPLGSRKMPAPQHG
jgi:hypothetical protein